MNSQPTVQQVNDQFKGKTYLVLIVGDRGTGKTSLMHKYLKDKVPQHNLPTVGVEFMPKIVKYRDDLNIRLQLWDMSGQARYKPITLP